MAKVKAKYHINNPDTKVYVGDNRKILRQLAKESVDLVFADPPFNWEVSYDKWKDNMPREEYLKFTYQWLDECIRVLAPHGAIWVNIPDDTVAEIVIHLKQRGLVMMNWCIWHFRFGQCRNNNFIVSKVHVLYFVKDPDNRIWNSDDILEPSDRATTYADHRTRTTKTPGMRVPLDVWYGPYWGRIQGNNKERRNNHQNQIPEVYLERVIRACSNEGDLILDPFLGSGTTCTVARALHRQSIGIEISPAHAKSALERIKQGTVRLESEFEKTINNAFFATHQGLSSDEIICDDALRNSFIRACGVKPGSKEEFDCNWELMYLRKAGKLGPTGKTRNLGTRQTRELAKVIANKIISPRSKPSIDRILCDPMLRSKFDKKAYRLAPDIDIRLVRKEALAIRKRGSSARAHIS